jgi:peptide/nickel transport system substrate-binding protein
MIDTRPTFLSRRNLLKGAAAAGLVTAFGAPKVERAHAADQKTLRVHALSDLTSLDPSFHSNETDEAAYYAVFLKLITYKSSQTYEWRLDAAESIEQVDETHIRFTLRPGIAWTNGYGELTAEDVKYSYERIADPAQESWFAGDWKALDHVEIVDDHNGVIVLKEPFAPLWTSTLPHVAGSIVCKKAVEEMGGRFKTEMPAQCGPYVLKEWKPNEHFTLARNPLWNGPKPDFDEIKALPISDPKAAELAFLAGELDAVKLATSSIPRYRQEAPTGAKYLERSAIGYKWIGINAESPPFDDERVRRAVQHAVDVDGILEAAFADTGKRATGIVAPSLIGHRAANNIGKRNLDTARQLLAEAGLADGFKARMHVMSQNEALLLGQVVQANLAEIGVELELIQLDEGAFWNLGNEEAGQEWKTSQLIYQDWGMAPDPYWGTSWFVCDQVGIWNWQRHCSPEFDKLNTEATLETDPAKRADMYVRMQSIMEDSGAYIFVTHGVNAWLHRDTIVPGLYADGLYSIYTDFKMV